MYCPKCGQEQTSAEALFCSRCGLNLSVVRTSLAGEQNRTFTTTTSPPHREINSGVGIMFLGTLFTSGFVFISDVGPAGAFLLLTVIFISVLLSSRHLTRAIHRLFSGEEPRSGEASAGKGMAFGALLMYVGTVLSTCAATLVPGRMWVPIFFFTLLSVCAILLLFSRRLMSTVHDLMTEEGPRPSGIPSPSVATASLPRVGAVAEGFALPPARLMPVTSLSSQQVSTAEIATPPSVTERTTNLLADKNADGSPAEARR